MKRMKMVVSVFNVKGDGGSLEIKLQKFMIPCMFQNAAISQERTIILKMPREDVFLFLNVKIN